MPAVLSIQAEASSVWEGVRLDTMPGKVAVGMLQATEHALALPDYLKDKMRPQVGVVLSRQFGCKTKGQWVFSPEPDTKVVVAPQDGLVLTEDGKEIRCYGHFTEVHGEPIPVEWWHSVLLSIMNNEFHAHGDKAILRPDPKENVTASGIWLPDSAVKKGARATVVSAGPLCDDLKAGDRVVYDPRAVEFIVEGLDVVSLTGICWREA